MYNFCFSLLRRKADPVYSEPLNVSGLSWRLKVYPVCIYDKKKKNLVNCALWRFAQLTQVLFMVVFKGEVSQGILCFCGENGVTTPSFSYKIILEHH